MPSFYPWAWTIPAAISLVTLIVGVVKLQRAEIRLDAIRTNDLKHLAERLDHVDESLKEIKQKMDEHIQWHLRAQRET